MGTEIEAALADGEAAFEAGDWEAAASAYQAAIELGAGARALDRLGEVRWFQCRIAEALSLRERAFAEHRRAGDLAQAAFIALWLAIEYMSSRGAEAIANGWLRRAERLLVDLPPCPAHVELEIARARRASDPAAAERHYLQALSHARSIDSLDQEVRALTTLGVHRVTTGDRTAGMALLDEAMATVLGGELTDPWSIGGVCCQMMAACDQSADWRRAIEWYGEVGPLVERRGYVPLGAWCRSVYGGILVATGDWERAETELLESLRTYGGPDQPMAAYPLARLAELRMRQGRFEEAERLIEGLEHHPRAVATGIALLLARGKPKAAAAACERRLARIGPTAGAGALLPLLVDARLALDDVAAARAASDRLLELARDLGRRDLVAAAEAAAARVSLLSGDGAAAAHQEAALELYAELGMPLEAARARAGLASILAAEGEAELAVEEARRAIRVFERLGARPDADAAGALLRRLGAAGRSGARLGAELTGRELEVLGLLAEGCSNAAIAERLVISPKTAEHHVSRILAKLGVASRAEAAAHAVRAGLSPSRSTAARSG